jgi:hypothetical protein
MRLCSECGTLIPIVDATIDQLYCILYQYYLCLAHFSSIPSSYFAPVYVHGRKKRYRVEKATYNLTRNTFAMNVHDD